MINACHQELNGASYPTAVHEENGMATAFSSSEQDVLWHVLRDLLYDTAFATPLKFF